MILALQGPSGPLQGLFKSLSPPVSFEDALRSISEHLIRMDNSPIDIDELNVAVIISGEAATDQKVHGDAKHDRITRDEIAAIYLYTMEFTGYSFYHLINSTLRAEDRNTLKPFVPYVWLFMHALNACPAFENTLVYRGVKLDIHADYQVGRRICWQPVTSATWDLGVQQTFCGKFGPRTMFHLEVSCRRGRMIHKYSQIKKEQEVVFPPGSRFEVMGVIDLGSELFMVNLKELPPLEYILRFDQPPASSLSAAAVQGATNQLSALTVSSPPPPVPS